MKLRIKSLITMAGLTLFGSTFAFANEVAISVNQPMEVKYRIAHKNANSQIVYESPQTIQIEKEVTIPMELNGYELTGLELVTVAGHDLPLSAREFDKPQQCSMTTDKDKTTGGLDLKLEPHRASCSTRGGIFA